MSTKDDCMLTLESLDELSLRPPTQEEAETIEDIADSIGKLIRASPWPDIDPNAYFIWMYSVVPFAEC